MMRARSRFDFVLVAYGVLVCLFYLPKLFWPDSWLFQDVLTERVFLFLSAPVKIAALVTGALFAGGCALRFDPGSTTRRAWWCLAS